MTSISDRTLLLPAAQKQRDTAPRNPNCAGAVASVPTKDEVKHAGMDSFMTRENPRTIACVSIEDQQMGSADMPKTTSDHNISTKSSLDMAAAIRSENPSPCPRCQSLDTKFCYFNNYNTRQPRHFCKSCQRYWTAGGSLRNLPVGAGKRKHKSSSAPASMVMKKAQRHEICGDADCDADLNLLIMKSRRSAEIDVEEDEGLQLAATDLQLCTQIVDDDDDDDDDDELGEVISAEAPPTASHSKIMKFYHHHHHHHLADGKKIFSEFGSTSKDFGRAGTRDSSSFCSATRGTIPNPLQISKDEEEGKEGSHPSEHGMTSKHQNSDAFSENALGFSSQNSLKTKSVNSTRDPLTDAELSQPQATISALAPQSSLLVSPSLYGLSPWGVPPMMAPWPWPPHMLNNGSDVSAAFAHASPPFWPFPPPVWIPFGWSSMPWNVVMDPTTNNNNCASAVQSREGWGQKQQQEPLCTPKTLKVGDPDEVMYSSVLTVLGLTNVASPSSVSAFFNADRHAATLDGSKQKVGMKQDHPQQPLELEKILYRNPAAFARSLAFQEGK